MNYPSKLKHSANTRDGCELWEELEHTKDRVLMWRLQQRQDHNRFTEDKKADLRSKHAPSPSSHRRAAL